MCTPTQVPAKSGEQGASSGVGGSSNCSNDCSGGLAMGPEEVVAQLLLFQQQQKQKQQQVGAGGGGGDGGECCSGFDVCRVVIVCVCVCVCVWG